MAQKGAQIGHRTRDLVLKTWFASLPSQIEKKAEEDRLAKERGPKRKFRKQNRR